MKSDRPERLIALDVPAAKETGFFLQWVILMVDRCFSNIDKSVTKMFKKNIYCGVVVSLKYPDIFKFERCGHDG